MLVSGNTAIEGMSGNGGASFFAGGIDAVVVVGRRERCCTNKMVPTMIASPTSENAPPRQCFRRDRSVALAVARVGPPYSITRNTRTGCAMFLTCCSPRLS